MNSTISTDIFDKPHEHAICDCYFKQMEKLWRIVDVATRLVNHNELAEVDIRKDTDKLKILIADLFTK